jgi:hypothetical protein
MELNFGDDKAERAVAGVGMVAFIASGGTCIVGGE